MSLPSKHNLLLLALVLSILIEVISIVDLTLAPSTETMTPDPFVGLMISVFNWLIPLSPFLILCLLYFPIVQAAFSWAGRRSEAFKHIVEELSSLKNFRKDTDLGRKEWFGLLAHPKAVLITSMIIAAFLAYFPYRPDINPQQSPVGIDTPYYITAIDSMLHQSFSSAFAYAFGLSLGGSRAIFLLSTYLAARFVNINGTVAVRYAPAVLAPLLVLASYILVSFCSENRDRAIMVAALTAFSPVVIVGIWAGYLANWLAISEGFAFLSVTFWQLRSPSIPRLTAIVGLSLLLLYTHPWTWVLTIAATFFLLFTQRREISSRKILQLIVPVASINVVCEILRRIQFGGFSGAPSPDYLAAGLTNPVSNVMAFFPNVVYAMTSTYAGLLANSVTLALALIAVLTLRYEDRFERLLLIWVVLTSLAFPFYDDLLQSRLVYDLPIIILASFGLLKVVMSNRLRPVEGFLTLLVVILYEANYSLLVLTRFPVI